MFRERLQVGILCVGFLKGVKRQEDGRRLMKMKDRCEKAEGRKKEAWECRKRHCREW